MSNHYHVVLHVDVARGASLSDGDVIQRWTRLYSGPDVIKRHKAGIALLEAERTLVTQITSRWRKRLCDISWFMRCLNEYLARRANAEDGCKGRFWEARFCSQALLDEAAVLSCMTYVDLNPIRAGIATCLEDSDFTSIQDRLDEIQRRSRRKDEAQSQAGKPRLMPFVEALQARKAFAGIPFNLRDYLELADWTGRIMRQDKRGFIPTAVPTILDRLGLSDSEWQLLALNIQKRSITMLNGMETMAALKQRRERQKAA